jgi:hypothetical protein
MGMKKAALVMILRKKAPGSVLPGAFVYWVMCLRQSCDQSRKKMARMGRCIMLVVAPFPA